MRIERVAPSQHIKGRVLVFLEGGECLKITEQELLDFDLRAGGELDGPILRRLWVALPEPRTRTPSSLSGASALPRLKW